MTQLITSAARPTSPKTNGHFRSRKYSPVRKAVFAFLLLPLVANAVSWQDYPAAGLLPCQYNGTYTSPYTVSYTISTDQLTYDFTSRYNSITSIGGNLTTPPYTSDVPANNAWYDAANYTLALPQSWGPQINGSLGAPSAPLNPDPSYGTLAWQQQRLVAIATQFQFVNGNGNGIIYQHHHIPQFNPYTTDPSWPTVLSGSPPITWGTANGGNSTAAPGIDCSDFTSLVYNLAFGYKLETGINAQAQPDTPITTPTGTMLPTAVIPGPNMNNGAVIDQNAPNAETTYNQITNQFQVGDLLYMHAGTGTPGNGTFSDVHVVMWLGTQNITFTNNSTGITGNATIPLVISSHNDTPAIWDENGVLPAPGVQSLPFSADSWFYTNFDHAQRLLVPEPGSVALAILGMGVVLVLRWRAIRNRRELVSPANQRK